MMCGEWGGCGKVHGVSGEVCWREGGMWGEEWVGVGKCVRV